MVLPHGAPVGTPSSSSSSARVLRRTLFRPLAQLSAARVGALLCDAAGAGCELVAPRGEDELDVVPADIGEQPGRVVDFDHGAVPQGLDFDADRCGAAAAGCR